MLDILPVNVPKAADVLAGILREKILEGDLREGADLPNERDLGVQSGLSRASGTTPAYFRNPWFMPSAQRDSVASPAACNRRA